MIRRAASALALVFGMLCGSVAAQIVYVGSATIGENILPEAAKAFTAKTGIALSRIGTQGRGIGLEMVLRGKAQIVGITHSLTPEEKQRRIYYRIIGYDAVGVYVHPANPVTSLTKQQLKAIYSGRITNWNEVGGIDAPIVCIMRKEGIHLQQSRSTDNRGPVCFRTRSYWRHKSTRQVR
jgi:phosphate transport system substrate-binding protein